MSAAQVLVGPLVVLLVASLVDRQAHFGCEGSRAVGAAQNIVGIAMPRLVDLAVHLQSISGDERPRAVRASLDFISVRLLLIRAIQGINNIASVILRQGFSLPATFFLLVKLAVVLQADRGVEGARAERTVEGVFDDHRLDVNSTLSFPLVSLHVKLDADDGDESARAESAAEDSIVVSRISFVVHRDVLLQVVNVIEHLLAGFAFESFHPNGAQHGESFCWWFHDVHRLEVASDVFFEFEFRSAQLAVELKKFTFRWFLLDEDDSRRLVRLVLEVHFRHRRSIVEEFHHWRSIVEEFRCWQRIPKVHARFPLVRRQDIFRNVLDGAISVQLLRQALRLVLLKINQNSKLFSTMLALHLVLLHRRLLVNVDPMRGELLTYGEPRRAEVAEEIEDVEVNGSLVLLQLDILAEKLLAQAAPEQPLDGNLLLRQIQQVDVHDVLRDFLLGDEALIAQVAAEGTVGMALVHVLLQAVPRCEFQRARAAVDSGRRKVERKSKWK